jgi:hypothetical protein
MAGRGPQSFKKRQKEQARKEWQEEKRARKLQRQQGKGQTEDINPEAEGSATEQAPAQGQGQNH